MRARVIVFPIKGRNWCFSRSIDPSLPAPGYSGTAGTSPTTLRGLWKVLSSDSKPVSANAELVVDFVSNKMNTAWTALEKAPEGSLKNKIHGVGVWLLTRVKPSELFLKSISKDVTGVDITYPASLNARLVRRRLRHIALSGTNIHKKYMYGSATLLPLTTAFTVLPLPNIPFFWLLFRTYSHWRARQGSELLLQLVSDSSQLQNDSSKGSKTEGGSSQGNEMATRTNWLSSMLRQQAKLTWLKSGDQCSSVFYKFIKKRRSKNLITSINDHSGNSISIPSDPAHHIVLYLAPITLAQITLLTNLLRTTHLPSSI